MKKIQIAVVYCPSCTKYTLEKPITFRRYKFRGIGYKVVDGYLCLRCGYPIKK